MGVDVEFELPGIASIVQYLLDDASHGRTRSAPVRREVQDGRDVGRGTRVEQERVQSVGLGVGVPYGPHGTGSAAEEQSGSDGKDRHDDKNCDPCHGFSISLRSMVTFSPDPSMTICEPSA